MKIMIKLNLSTKERLFALMQMTTQIEIEKPALANALIPCDMIRFTMAEVVGIQYIW